MRIPVFLARKDLLVSIHAPVWGAKMTMKPRRSTRKFQSTHPCGVRINDYPRTARKMVSIHAPVWGANIKSFALFGFSQVSIHAPVWGAKRGRDIFSPNLLFQSTHPCGVRIKLVKKSLSTLSFNPRTRVGCEENWGNGSKQVNKFQSTHPCGVRRMSTKAHLT